MIPQGVETHSAFAKKRYASPPQPGGALTLVRATDSKTRRTSACVSPERDTFWLRQPKRSLCEPVFYKYLVRFTFEISFLLRRARGAESGNNFSKCCFISSNNERLRIPISIQENASPAPIAVHARVVICNDLIMKTKE